MKVTNLLTLLRLGAPLAGFFNNFCSEIDDALKLCDF